MPRVEVRLTELQEAATRFSTSANRIKESIDTVNEVIDGIMALGYESQAAMQTVLRFRAQRDTMDDWLDQLLYFSARLNEASDELERALLKAPTGSIPVPPAILENQRRPVLSDREIAHIVKNNQAIEATLDSFDPAPEAPAPKTYSLDEFVSEVNKGVYNELTQRKAEAEAARSMIAELVGERAQVADELAMLETRLKSYNPDVNLDSVARVQALRAEIETIDANIAATQGNLARIEDAIAELTTRLERVKPGAGADLQLIQQMVGAQSADYIRASTEGCVQYIVTRMPIPDGIPRDAHLWNEQAARFVQYGITSGDVPLEGSVLVMEPAHEYADDVYGHLLYVERVINGEVWVTDNYHPNTPVRLSDITTELSGPNMTYLYFPWQTRA